MIPRLLKGGAGGPLAPVDPGGVGTGGPLAPVDPAVSVSWHREVILQLTRRFSLRIGAGSLKPTPLGGPRFLLGQIERRGGGSLSGAGVSDPAVTAQP